MLIDSYAVMGETGNVQADSGRSASLFLGRTSCYGQRRGSFRSD